jgi:hypothetical protein
MKYLIGFILLCTLGCQKSKQKAIEPSVVIGKAIEFSGKSKLNENVLKFKFRDYSYKAIPTCEGFQFERLSITSPTRDIVKNGELKRFYQDSVIKLADTTAFSYYKSVNSVHYFTQLPLRLVDDAVRSSYLGEEEINGKAYHKLKIKFTENDGGEDFEDAYMYWFDTSDFSMDFIAYSFLVNSGGLRFRKAINQRTIDGVVFQDYENYNPKETPQELEDLGQLWGSGDLELISKIENENVTLKSSVLNCN